MEALQSLSAFVSEVKAHNPQMIEPGQDILSMGLPQKLMRIAIIASIVSIYVWLLTEDCQCAAVTLQNLVLHSKTSRGK